METTTIRSTMHLWSAFYDWGSLNVELFRIINGATFPWMEPVLIGLTAIGSYWGAPALFLLLLLLGWRRALNDQHDLSAHTFRQIRRFVVGFAITWVVVAFFKLTLNVPRPLSAIGGAINVAGDPEYMYGFPSGHAAYTMLAIFILWPIVGRPYRYALLTAGALVAWARIASGAHFPADILWGAAIGACSAYVATRVTADPKPSTWLGLAAAIVGLDQLTKSAVIKGISYDTFVPVTSFFDLVHTRNTGAAFSLFAQGSGWQTWFLIVLAFIVSAWLAWRLTKPTLRLEAAGYCLILGGGVANAIDRLINGYVTDFLSFYWRDWYWPAFNLADVAISSGAALLIASTVLFDRPSTASKHV
jgi:signal peptidase II